MSIQISGIQLGPIHGGPSALNLEDLHDVSIVAPLTGQYLRYNSGISGWQNSFINSDVYNYLNTNLTSSDGISLTKLSGPETVNISLSLSTTGDVTGSVIAGMLPITLNSVNSNVGTYGSPDLIPVVTVNAKGLITGISTVSAGGGSAATANNLAGGATGGLPYQSATATTTFLPAGTTSDVLISGATGPSWTNSPTLSGINFSNIPNASLVNNTLTIGSTNIALGATVTTLAGLTSVTATSFIGNADTATTAGTVTTAAQPNITSVGTLSSLSVTGTVSAGTFTGSGAGLTNIPNSAFTNNSLTIGSTSIALGATATTLAGLTSVTSTTFVGALSGAASANVLKSGDTMSGYLILNADPVNSLGAATKQ